MACRCLVGLEKGNCAFIGCFQVSAAGGFVYIYTHARTRKGFGLGRAFLFAGKFRKQNKVGSDTLTGLENKTMVGMKKQSTGFFSVVGRVSSRL